MLNSFFLWLNWFRIIFFYFSLWKFYNLVVFECNTLYECLFCKSTFEFWFSLSNKSNHIELHYIRSHIKVERWPMQPHLLPYKREYYILDSMIIIQKKRFHGFKPKTFHVYNLCLISICVDVFCMCLNSYYWIFAI